MMWTCSRALLSVSIRRVKQKYRLLATATKRGKEEDSWKPKVAIFDKNGTLINFHTPWVPWAHGFSKRLEERTGFKMKDKVLSHLDVCAFTNKVRSGILAHGTSNQIKREVRKCLKMQGMSEEEAADVVDSCWRECDTSDPQTLQELTNLRALFKALANENIKIAVTTSGGRNNTERTLDGLNLTSYVDALTCGDDHVDDVLPVTRLTRICESLGLEPRDAAVIGDTEHDMLMGMLAGARVNIGVLSGIGTRLELAHHADIITQNVQEALPVILNPPAIKAGSRSHEKGNGCRAGAVIFDKDGTLLCFHSTWTPWVNILVQRLERETGLKLNDALLDGLGYSQARKKWVPGVFTEGTDSQSRDKIVDILQKKGLDFHRATEAIRKSWTNDDAMFSEDKFKPLDDPLSLFKTLKRNDIKIAVCTSDSRPSAEAFLKSLGLDDYVDAVICGDDPSSQPKPSPHNALAICKQLNVHPSRTVVVGDSMFDMSMGRAAELGATVGVLSGVADVEHLAEHADYVVPSIKHVLPLVVNKHSNF